MQKGVWHSLISNRDLDIFSFFSFTISMSISALVHCDATDVIQSLAVSHGDLPLLVDTNRQMVSGV